MVEIRLVQIHLINTFSSSIRW